jgi:hypothetical protein
MNNIPQDILQQVADAAFAQSPSSPLSCAVLGLSWPHQAPARLAVIQHALDNPALAPFLSGGGEYTDQAIYDAWKKAVEDNDAFPDRMRTFLAAFPRRESPALAEAIARAEKAEAELAAIKSSLPSAEATPQAEPDLSAQVPLGPEDVPPGSVFRSQDQPDTSFWTVSQVWERGFYLRGEIVDWYLAMERMEINTSIPDTGRWDATAWRKASKKEVAK